MFRYSKLVVAVMAFTASSGLVQPSFGQEGAAQSFARKAAVSNRFEIDAAKIALEKGKDQSAMKFAQDMMNDHSESLVELEEAAKAENVSIPATLDPDNTAKLAALNKAPTTDFDQAYLSTQVAAHEDAVRMFMAYSKDGPDGALKNYATKTVGTLRTHNIRIHGLTHQ